MRLAPILLASTLLAMPWALTLPPAPAFAQAAPERGPVAALASVSPGAACSRDLPQQDESEPPTEFERRASAKDPCAVADDNLARDEAEILKPKPPAAAAPREAWDHKSKPQFFDAIVRRSELQPEVRSSLRWPCR